MFTPTMPFGLCARQTLQAALMPFIVEAEPVDHGLVVGQPEDARARIAGLRQGRDGAHLRKAEA